MNTNDEQSVENGPNRALYIGAPGEVVALLNTSREPCPEPCRDCGRTYLNGENITLMVPTPEGGQRAAWSGCVDCWVARTSPERP